jgi:uncharacterized Zn finger protein
MTSVRKTRCPECDGTTVDTEPLEENAHSLNVRAMITCLGCGHVWEGPVSNPARRGTWGGLPVGVRRKK